MELDLAFGQAINLSVAEIFRGLFLAAVLGIWTALLYRVSIPNRLLSPAMQGSLVLLAMIGAMIMMVIGNNVARAFSLVGALAIIRFRTRLRSPWDISFVFLSLAVGIACGVLAYRVAIVGAVMITLVVLGLYSLNLAGVKGDVHLLRVDLAAWQGTEKDLFGAMDPHIKQRWMTEARSLRFGETLSYRYRVVLRPEASIEGLLRALADLEGVERVIFDADDEGTGQTN